MIPPQTRSVRDSTAFWNTHVGLLMTLFTVLIACPAVASAGPSELRIVGQTTRVDNGLLTWHGWLWVRTDSESATRVTPVVEAQGARVVEPIQGNENSTNLFALKLALGGTAPGHLQVTLREHPQLSVSSVLRPAMDLSRLDWESWWAGVGTSLATVRGLPQSGVSWKPIQLPTLWQELGVTWLRCKFRLPDVWRDKPLVLDIGAIDDHDAAYCNGREIGRTHGWDTPRKYRIPPETLHWNELNEICIAVDNVNAGGGVYRLPIELRPVEVASTDSLDPLLGERTVQDEARRAPPEPIAPSAPLRPMLVRDGTLRYLDGGEVALWGVNYYPQSWVEYESLKKLGIEHRQAIDHDLDDLKRVGIQIIRIHVFDSEISDAAGNLVRNDHLDVLDYLVSQCDARGIYLMLTPIAWWGSPSARPDSFSQNMPKQGMTLWPAAWPAQANYLRQFLAHENPYTKRRLVDEPCLTLFEVINEPTYWSFAEIIRNDPGYTGGTRAENVPRAQQGVRAAWREMIPGENWKSPHGYALFRCETVRRYIDAMVTAIRSTGARQPIAYFANPWGECTDVFQAIADSRCEAITLGTYPGGLPQKPENDRKNLLRAIGPKSVDARLARKARLAYEFDAAGTLNLVAMYPAIARYWREHGVQVACQFQYDPRATAHVNWDWPQHYLNLWYTPEKMASFLIGGEVFRRVARGVKAPSGVDDYVFTPAAVSFQHNAAILSTDDCYMQARATDWHPLPTPSGPKRIVSVGNCPFFDYSGTGMVDLRIDGDIARLRIYPDVDRLRGDLQGTVEKPLARLQLRSHPFHLRLPGWDGAEVQRESPGGWTNVSIQEGQFIAEPGEYRCSRPEPR